MIDAVEKRLFSACSTLFMLLVVIKITLNPAPLAQSAWYFYIFFPSKHSGVMARPLSGAQQDLKPD